MKEAEYHYFPQHPNDKRPGNRDMTSHHIESKPNGIRHIDGTEGQTHVAVFVYPDRVVEHDGQVWRNREVRTPEPNIFTN